MMAKSESELEALASQIKGLTPAMQLRLAADLIEHHKYQLAHSIAERVVNEMGAVITLRKLGAV